MDKTSFKKYLTPKVIISVIVIVLILVYIGYTRSDNRVTWTMYRASKGEIQLLNDEGKTITLPVVYLNNPGTGDNPYKNVGVKTIQKENVYYAYTRDATSAHNTRDIKAPIDMAFFDQEGNLLNIFQARANNSTSYRAINTDGERIPYRYVIMTAQGFWAKNNISEGTEAKRLTDKVRRK